MCQVSEQLNQYHFPLYPLVFLQYPIKLYIIYDKIIHIKKKKKKKKKKKIKEKKKKKKKKKKLI